MKELQTVVNTQGNTYLTVGIGTHGYTSVKGLEAVTAGQEVLTAVALLRGRANRIDKDNAAGVACLIASADSNAQFRKLKLTFGTSNTNEYTGSVNDSAVLGLTVYLERRKIGTKEVNRGEKQVWEVDVVNAQNIALEAECIKPKISYYCCPSVMFAQANLE